jgi:hypothetical protein
LIVIDMALLLYKTVQVFVWNAKKMTEQPTLCNARGRTVAQLGGIPLRETGHRLLAVHWTKFLSSDAAAEHWLEL